MTARAPIVVCSLEPWDDVWRRNQHLLDRLLTRDPERTVLFVEPPRDPLHALTQGHLPRRGAGLRRLDGYDGRLWCLEPTKWLPRVMGAAAQRAVDRQAIRAVRSLGWTDPVLWINDPRSVGMLDTGWPSLYDITDDWARAQRPSRQLAVLTSADQRLLAQADAVVVCSPDLQERKGGLLIRNAVDVDAYRAPGLRPRDLPAEPVAVYVGTLHEDRLDLAVVQDTARALAAQGGTLALVGPNALTERHTAILAGTPGLAILGPRPSPEVPRYLTHASVVVLPHIVDAFTDSLDPIKLYEYLASARPIVATPAAGFRNLDAAGLVVVPTTEFASATARLAFEGAAAAPRTGIPTWDQRAESMRGVLDSVQRGAS